MIVTTNRETKELLIKLPREAVILFCWNPAMWSLRQGWNDWGFRYNGGVWLGGLCIQWRGRRPQ